MWSILLAITIIINLKRIFREAIYLSKKTAPLMKNWSVYALALQHHSSALMTSFVLLPFLQTTDWVIQVNIKRWYKSLKRVKASTKKSFFYALSIWVTNAMMHFLIEDVFVLVAMSSTSTLLTVKKKPFVSNFLVMKWKVLITLKSFSTKNCKI